LDDVNRTILLAIKESLMTCRWIALSACGLAAVTAITLGAQAPPAQGTKPAAQKPAVQKPAAQKPAAQKPAPKPATGTAALRTPAKLKETAPATFRAAFETTAGQFVVEVQRAWAPKGADRFYNLVKNGYYNNCRFFRVIPKFMVQFGINGDPRIQTAWRNANLTDDPVKQSNRRGTITFATAGPDSRTTQVFINLVDNGFLDQQGFAPFGQVVTGMEVVDKINSEYREQPDQGDIQSKGNAYLVKAFPRLDYIKSATIVK
jgi:peptidyl-prolyl cis-trans isomerase A (cyclophilin A)